MKSKIRAGFVLLAVALTLLSIAAGLKLVTAISVEKVYVDFGQTPPETGVFLSGREQIDSIISVSVSITNVQDLFSWQIQLYYDPTLIAIYQISGFQELIHIFYGKSAGSASTIINENYVRVNQSLMSGLGVTEPGTKLLVRIYLKIIKPPPKPADPSVPLSSKVSCVLNITNPDTRLADSAGNELSGSAWKQNGKYEYYWSEPQQRPYLTAVPNVVYYRRDPPPAVGQRFNITIFVKSLDPLHGGLDPTWELVNMSFVLNFDPMLLEVADIVEGDFLKKFGTTTFASSGLAGKAVVNQIYLNPPYSDKFPKGPGAVAIVQFNITYQGQYPAINKSALNITDISFKDHYGNNIPYDSAKVENSTCTIEGLLEPKIEVVDLQTGEPTYRFFTSITPLGSRFNVTIVATVGDLFTYQVYLVYNTTMLRATHRSWLPTWDNSSVPWVFFGRSTVKTAPAYYEDAVKIADTMIEKEPPQPTFTGRGKLAIIEFEIIATAPAFGNISSAMNITNTDTFVLDSHYVDIPAPRVNGYFEYVWAETLPALEVKPSVYTAVEQEAFNVTIWMNTISIDKRLTSIEFKLHYDSSLLDAVKVSEEAFLASIGFTFDYYLSEGYVTIKYYLNVPYTVFPDGSGPIATVTFDGIYQNSKENNSTLELIDIILIDGDGSPLIYAPPVNGFYKILPFGSSILTIEATPSSVHVGSHIAISGTLKPLRSNVNITIHCRNPEGTWNELDSTKTDSFSNYTVTWVPTTAGTYEIKATWPGDDGTDPAESEPIAVTVEAASTSDDFLLYVVIGTCIAAVVVVVLIYMLKIRKR